MFSASYFWEFLAVLHWWLWLLLFLLEFWWVLTGTGDPNHPVPIAFLPENEKNNFNQVLSHFKECLEQYQPQFILYIL